LPAALDDQRIGVDKRPVEFGGNDLGDGGFPAAHKADKDDVLRNRHGAVIVEPNHRRVRQRMTTHVAPTDSPKALEAAVRLAAELLKAGEPVALPTETVYGLAANALDPVAVARVFAAKDRPEFDPLIVHLGRPDALRDVAEVPDDIARAVERLIGTFWPGPLTIILPKKPVISDLVTSGLPTLAVRVPAHPISRRVLKACGFPLAAPSANRFGRISATSAAAVLKELGGRIPLIVDGGACPQGVESTIIRITAQPGKTKPLVHILRAGPITREQLQPHAQVRFASAVDPASAPGQLASHYAPRTPLRLLEPSHLFHPEPGKRYALLSFHGEPKNLNLSDFVAVEALSPGSGKLQEAAIRFFAVLRQLDEVGADEIIAEPVTEVGVGVAIMDRLRKAAAKK
jgi:L-threonylcarbamoyladenylate synthase